MHIYLTRLKMRIDSSRLTFILVSLCYLLWAANASAKERETYPYKCSDGNFYSVWVDPEPMGGFTAQGPRLQFRAFCKAEARTIIECIKDEARATRQCLSEFKSYGNLSHYEGSTVIIGNSFREPTGEMDIVTQKALDISTRRPASVVGKRPRPVKLPVAGK